MGYSLTMPTTDLSSNYPRHNRNRPYMMKTDELKALLESQGIKLTDAAKVIRSLNKEVADEKAAEFEAKKESNKDTMIDIMADIRQQLESSLSDCLPGTHINFTARVTKEGNIISTANDCHASGFRDSYHMTPDGDVVTGEEGAALAKNVRPRKKND